MKRAYKKRRAYKYNYAALTAMLAVLIMVVVCIAGMVVIIKSVQEKTDTESKNNPAMQGSSEYDGSSQSSTEFETVTKEVATPAKPDYSCFEGAAFVGDSRVGSIYLSAGVTPAKFFYKVGLQVHKFTTEVEIVGNNSDKSLTIIDLLSKQHYDKIFVEVGVNHLGITDATFISSYTDVINAIRNVRPDAEIYIMSIIPVSSQYEVKNPGANDNIKRLNADCATIAKNCGVNFLNLAPVFGDGDSLPEDSYNANTDGAHLNKDYNLRIMNYIKKIVYKLEDET
ncbi:MAG: GDSL-type esterase/lipase family protein [Lachnospiraceae bacterium]